MPGLWPLCGAIVMATAGTATSAPMPTQVHGPLCCTGGSLMASPIAVALAASVDSEGAVETQPTVCAPCKYFDGNNKESSVFSVAFLRVKFSKAQHRGHKESQRTTEKSAFLFPSSVILL